MKKRAVRRKKTFGQKCTENIIRSSPRNELQHRQEAAGLEVAFGRGYQVGYQDRVMGREPKMYAFATRKDVRENEGGEPE
ncbi:MAG TPA: hypothetical protein ENH62_03210 [Marinobacter sp.]|uniref:Uncharacterized protein n=1 Tax=marine sediment metagenome TaxID=412755 RepID=A0A0F9LQ05_9ZZZZ|nr:hypothetical protein [Marinobacter sp.]